MTRSRRLSPRALRDRINADDRAYYANIVREYPWPVSAILASSPASKPSIDEAVRLSRRCECVAFDWLLEDIGWQPAPDEQGALLRHHAKVRIDALETDKRPVSAVADFTEARDVVAVEIHENRHTKTTLLYDREFNLEERVIKEQFAS